MGRKAILIGSCGGLAGSYLVRQFQKKGGLFVMGADISPHHAARRFADECIVLPGADAPDFCGCLVEALKQYGIDYYVPTHSHEIKTVAQNEARIREAWNGSFLVSPYETFLKLNNKREANEALRRIGLPVPSLIAPNAREIRYPVFMKPDVGSGGRKSQAVESAALRREYARLYPDCGFYELIRGTEYTVDCMFDDGGKLIAYNQRTRLKSMGGAVIITQNHYDFDILPYLKKLENAFTFKGCVNFQYILSDGVPYFIDVNLRYAAGGLPLTVESGIDVPQILLDIWERKPVSGVKSCGADRKTMYRYFEEWYEDED